MLSPNLLDNLFLLIFHKQFGEERASSSPSHLGVAHIVCLPVSFLLSAAASAHLLFASRASAFYNNRKVSARKREKFSLVALIMKFPLRRRLENFCGTE